MVPVDRVQRLLDGLPGNLLQRPGDEGRVYGAGGGGTIQCALFCQAVQHGTAANVGGICYGSQFLKPDFSSC